MVRGVSVENGMKSCKLHRVERDGRQKKHPTVVRMQSSVQSHHPSHVLHPLPYPLW